MKRRPSLSLDSGEEGIGRVGFGKKRGDALVDVGDYGAEV